MERLGSRPSLADEIDARLQAGVLHYRVSAWRARTGRIRGPTCPALFRMPSNCFSMRSPAAAAFRWLPRERPPTASP
jgi:hypothetical protein